MEKKVFEAKSFAEAKMKAYKELDVNPTLVEIVSQTEKKGFLGIGKKIVIEVVVKSETKDTDEILNEEKVETSKKSVADSEPEHLADTVDMKPQETMSGVNIPDEDTELKNLKTKIVASEIEKKNNLKTKTIKGEITNPKYEDLIDYLYGIIENFDLSAEFEITNEEDNVHINIETDNNAFLIGKGGNTIDSLSVLAKIYKKNLNLENTNFIVDIGGYKKAKIEKVKKVALNAAKKVEQQGRSYKLYPMNAYERMIVHTVLSEIDTVETFSVGNNPNRCVVVKPV